MFEPQYEQLYRYRGLIVVGCLLLTWCALAALVYSCALVLR